MGLLVKVGGSHIAFGREASEHGVLALGPLHLDFDLRRLWVGVEWRGETLFFAESARGWRPENVKWWATFKGPAWGIPEGTGGYFLGLLWERRPLGYRAPEAAA